MFRSTSFYVWAKWMRADRVVLCKASDQEVTSIPKLGHNFTDIDS